jgi:hypothetical protein
MRDLYAGYDARGDRPVGGARDPDGCAAPVVLASTNERTLEVVPLEALLEHKVDVPDDLANL